MSEDPTTNLPKVWAQHRPKLAGSWRLKSFEIHDVSTTPHRLLSKPHGDQPEGRVVITPGQFMSAQLTPPSVMRPFETGADMSSAADAEVAARVREMSFYCGHFELYDGGADGGLVFATTVEISCDLSRLGGRQFRSLEYWEEEGGKLLMLLRPLNKVQGTEPGVKEAYLVWEKFESI